jgi:hypothetical protein
MDLCVEFIVSRFDESGPNLTTSGDSESGIQYLSGDVREKLLLQLLKRRKLTAINAMVCET